MLAAVLFDLDDTLIEDKSATHRAVSAWAEDLGVTDPGIVRLWADISARHHARYQRREATFVEQRRDRVRDLLDVDLGDDEADALFATYLKHYEAAWTAFADALPTLRRVRAAGLPVAILTNGEESQQRRKLDRLSLLPEVDLLVASSALPAGKPDPRAFEHTLRLLGIEPSAALMVGDSLPKDVLAAQAAGLQAVLLDRDGTHRGLDVPRVRSLHDLVLPT